MDRQGLVIAPARYHEESHWEEYFLRALTDELRVDWLTPRDALGRRWKRVESHSELVRQYNALLDAERFAAFTALEDTEIASEPAGAVALS